MTSAGLRRYVRRAMAPATCALVAVATAACASHKPLFGDVPRANVITSEMADPEGDGVRYWDSEARAYVDGPDLVFASLVLDVAPSEGESRLTLMAKLAPSAIGVWRARIHFALDLDSTPVTPSYVDSKGVWVDIEPSGEAFVSRGLFRLGRLPVTVQPPWGSGHAGEDGLRVTIPLSWLGRRTPAFPDVQLRSRKWPEWLGHRGRPLSWRVTVSTDAPAHDRLDSLPDKDLPPAQLPIPR